MGAMTVQYPSDSGFVWLAVDDSRHVGLLFPQGQGPVAMSALKPGELVGAALLEKLSALPKLGVAEPQFQADVPADAAMLATLGFYVLIWTGDAPKSSTSGSVYEVVQAPSYARSVDQLPESLAEVANRNCLEGVNFPACRTLGVPVEGVTP